jgi:hypothetical protein
MQNVTQRTVCSTRGEAGVGPCGWRLPLAVVMLVGSLGCGPTDDFPDPPALEVQEQGLGSTNGFSVNGFSVNGFSVNGFSVNGLPANGLSASALSTEGFAAWFAQEPALAAHMMSYVVQCAVPAGQTRSYTDPGTGQIYTWSGRLGLARDWAGGAAINEAEQQVITACLLAHVNRYEQHLPISVLGRDARGNLIPYTLSELNTYSAREACFFGNLFTNEGLFFGVDRLIDHNAYLSRACAGMGSSGGGAGQCEPLTFVGGCLLSCLQLIPELGGPFHRTCMHNGKSYRAITTRMRASDYQALFED